MSKKINIKGAIVFQRSSLLALWLLVCLSACSGINSAAKSNLPHTSSSSATEQPKRAISVVDLQAVQGIEAIIPRLANYRAVLVGEQHTTYGDHLNQLAVIKHLHQQWPQMAIGLEFIQQPFQKVLDDYIARRLSERDMLRQTEWYQRWKYDFRLYRSIFEFARLNKIPLIALNVPTELTKRISKVGLQGLTAKERQQLPSTIDQSNTAYKAYLNDIFKLHLPPSSSSKSSATSGSKKANKHFEHFYQAQLAWDEGMAASAARYLLQDAKRRMVLLAGGGHMINRHGIPSRLERRINSKVAVVLNHNGEQPNASQGDFLLFSPAAKLPKAGLLGVFMRQAENGVILSTIMPKGAAKKAGLKKGDVLLAIDDNKVNGVSDVKLALLDAKPNEKKTVSILRGKKKLQKAVVLQ